MACSCYHKDMLRREIERSEKYKSGYLIAAVKSRDYKNRYEQLLKKWNDLVPDYNKLLNEKKQMKAHVEDIEQRYNELGDDNEELHAEIYTLMCEIESLKKIKLKDE